MFTRFFYGRIYFQITVRFSSCSLLINVKFIKKTFLCTGWKESVGLKQIYWQKGKRNRRLDLLLQFSFMVLHAVFFPSIIIQLHAVTMILLDDLFNLLRLFLYIYTFCCLCVS